MRKRPWYFASGFMQLLSFLRATATSFARWFMRWMRSPTVWKLFFLALLTAVFFFGLHEIPKYPRASHLLQVAFGLLPGLTGYFFAMAGCVFRRWRSPIPI